MKIPFLQGPWPALRVLQLVFGLLLLGSYFLYYHDGFTLAFSLLLLAQAAFNIGCPLGGACAAPPRRQVSNRDAAEEEEEVVYEEIR